MTASPLDPYAVLGVTVEASDDDLDHAFRELVRVLHPDTRKPELDHDADDADRRLHELLNAYATLRDPIRRAAYDRTLARTTAPTAVSMVSRANAASPRPRPEARVGDVARTYGEPAIRVGPVHWEPPRPEGKHDGPC